MFDSDRRHFKRYKKNTNINVLFGGASHAAILSDYSATGVSIELKEGFFLNLHSTVDIESNNPFIKTKGEVIWIARSPDGEKVGIRRESPISGLLTDYNLADTLIGLQRSGKTGMLEIASGAVRKKIYVKDGDMVFAASSREKDRLGDILLEEGVIDKQQYDRSVELLKKTGKRQGRILVELGYLSPKGLVDAVRDQVERIITGSFLLENGEFVFIEGPLPTDEVITLRLSAADLIYRGIMSIEDEARIRRLCPPIDSIPCLSPDPLDLFQSINLNEKDKIILKCIDCKKTVKEIIRSLSFDELHVMQFIGALTSTNIVNMTTSSSRPEVSPEEITKLAESKEKMLIRTYKRNVKFNLKHKWMLHSAELTDYSLNGASVLLPGSPDISAGDEVELRITSPSLPRLGKVLKKEKTPGGLIVEIETEWNMAGNIEDFFITDILVGLQMGKKSGELEIKSGKAVRSLYLINGNFNYFTSSVPEETIENSLHERGIINDRQYDTAVDLLKASGKRIDEILVIKPEDLREATEQSAERIILSLIVMRSGKFRFREGKFLSADMQSYGTYQMLELIYNAVKKDVAKLTPDSLPFLSPGAVIDLSSYLASIPESIKPDVIDTSILNLIDGKKTIKELLSLLSFDETHCIKSILALFSIKAIDILIEKPHEAVKKEEEKETADAVIRRIENTYQNHEALGYYGILSIDKTASAEDIKKSYYKAAKLYHPDGHFQLGGNVKFKLDKIFSYVSEAYSTLIDPEKRRLYDLQTEMSKNKGVLSKEKSAEQSFDKGKKALLLNKIEDAVRSLAEAVYFDPNALYSFYYARALNLSGKYKDAERAIRASLSGNPNNPEYNVEAGYIYMNLGFPARAKACFEKAQRSPSYSTAANEGLSSLKRKFGKSI